MTTTKKQRVPALRFPEFSGEWEEKKLGEVILDYKGGAPLKPSDFTEISNFEVIPKKGITRGGKLVLNLEEPTFCKADFYKKNQSSVIDNNYLVTTLRDLVPSGPNIGYIVRFENENEYLLAQGVYGVKIDKDKLNENYLIQYSNTDTYRELMKKIMVGSTQVHIRNTVYFNIDIPYTILPEQQKIADFLSSVDERIRLLKEKKANLEAYKRGAMQQVFSQSLRFKDENGNDYPDWRKIKLGEVTDKFVDKNKSIVDAPVYSVTNYDGFVLQSEHFDGKVAGADLSAYKIVQKGDFAYNPARINVGSIGYFEDEIGVISSLYVCFRTTKDILDKFLMYILDLESTKYQIENLGEGGVRIYLWYELFSKIKCSIPCLAEQQQIANFLSAIDTKITLCSEQIAQAEVYKKGLLQKMFV